MQSDFYRIQRDSQDFCNLIVSEPFELTEHESRSIGLWEAVNKILNTVVHFLPKNLSLNQRRLFPRPGIPVIHLGFTLRNERIRRIVLDGPLEGWTAKSI